VLELNWGPLSGWAAATASSCVAVIAILASFGIMERFRGPHLRLSFQDREPWCRATPANTGGHVLWVRIGVQNRGHRTAKGCIGMVTRLATDGESRSDIDPVQMRWAGFPRFRGFDAIDLKEGETEYLNVLLLDKPARWRLLTFEDRDFDPGFSTELEPGCEHLVTVAVFADNLGPVSATLRVIAGDGIDGRTLELAEVVR
jgi:hypothetical protein